MKSTLFQILAACVSVVAANEQLTATSHASHIFNAVHNAMRQWGSSVQHNGMTAFVATVPADVELYHGTGLADRVNGTQWLAFEPEHALLFASHLHGRPPGSRRPPPSSPDGQRSVRIPKQPTQERLLQHDPDAQSAVKPDTGEDERPLKTTHGYLHTYRTRHALRLLYVDGQSAAKSLKGTLDMQDVAILNGELGQVDEGDGNSGPMHEHERAQALCNRARDQWDDRIDGVLRMEGGFEIILCSFERHLDVVSIKRTKDKEMPKRFDHADLVHPRGSATHMLAYYKAVASRYDGIGGGRVQLDTNSGMLSLYGYADAVVRDDQSLPRVNNVSASTASFRADLDRILSSPEHDMVGSDWQAVTDMIVARYADKLDVMSKAKKLSELRELLEVISAPFIDYGHRDAHAEVMRCANKDLPRGSLGPRTPNELDRESLTAKNSLSTAGKAVVDVSYRICRDLHEMSSKNSLSAMLKIVQALKAWLDWPIWKRCQGCAANEVCWTPIWPAGSIKDYEKPSCKSVLDWNEDSDAYWRDH